MYCICKDEDISVDMTLWNMLSRKVGNLGAVFDGSRAKLNAVEQDMSNRKTESSSGNIRPALAGGVYPDCLGIGPNYS